MPDLPLFELDAEGRWRLAYDQHQWIVQRRDGRRTWRGIAFIGSKKSSLWRMFRERQIWLTDEAIARVDALPDHFFSFLRQHDPELATRHPIYSAHTALRKAHTARSRVSEQPTARGPEIELDAYSTPADKTLQPDETHNRARLVSGSGSDHPPEAPGAGEDGVDLDLAS